MEHGTLPSLYLVGKVMEEGHAPCVKDLSVLGLSDYNIESLTVDHCG
jgi:hypothetical protein